MSIWFNCTKLLDNEATTILIKPITELKVYNFIKNSIGMLKKYEVKIGILYLVGHTEEVCGLH